MRRALFLSGLAATVALAAFTGWWAGRNLDPVSRSQAAEEPKAVTYPVSRESLELVVITRGEMSYGPLADVRLAGAGGTVTVAPVSDRVYREGDVVMEMDLRPMVVMEGPRPMFRPFSAGTEGADVRQLQQALDRLGHPVGEVDGAFGPVTIEAWEAFQTAIGVAPVTTAIVSDVLFVPQLPARLSEADVAVGDTVGGQSLKFTQVDPVLVATVPVANHDAIAAGQTVRVETDRAAGTGWEGRIAAAPNETGGDGRYLATVESSASIPESDSYRITIVVDTSDGEGWVVPASAVFEAPSGGSYVTLSTDAGSSPVPVEVVFSSGPMVMIEGDVNAEDRVLVGPDR